MANLFDIIQAGDIACAMGRYLDKIEDTEALECCMFALLSVWSDDKHVGRARMATAMRNVANHLEQDS